MNMPSDTLSYREATTADQATVVQIMNQAITKRNNAHLTPLTNQVADEWFSSLARQAISLQLVLKGNEVIAWGSLTPYRSGRGALASSMEVTFYVDSQHHRQGIGSALLTQLIKLAKEKSCRHLIAILLDDNHGSIALLERFGFEQWANFKGIVHYPEGDKGHLYMGIHLLLNP